MKSQAILCSAAVALGVATGSLLAPQAASADSYDFNFSVGGVTGTITNLVDGLNICAPGTCVVSVTGGLPLPEFQTALGIYDRFSGGFTVTGGFIASADWFGNRSAVSIDLVNAGGLRVVTENRTNSTLRFGQGALATYSSVLSSCAITGPASCTRSFSNSARTPEFSLQARRPDAGSAVPGPLPVLGAAAAFGYSRRLRKRIISSRTTVSSAPFA